MVLFAAIVTYSSSSNKGFTSADVMFAQMMIPHHEQAITMATMAMDSERGSSRDLQDIALRIIDAQASEVQQMHGLLDQWNASAMHSHDDDMMQGVLSADELDALDRLNGRPFDLAWSKAMIRHHRGAIAMARDVLLAGTNKQITTLAHNVITAQRREIGQLRAVIGSAQP